MSRVISESKGRCDLVDTVHIGARKLHGFLAFARLDEQAPWISISPVYPIGITPPNNRPLPLFESRAAAISYAQENSWVGSEVKIFEVRE